MVFFGLMTLFSSIFIDKYNRRNILALSCLSWSLCTLSSGFVNKFWQLFMLRILVGLSEALFAPAAYSLITDYLPPKYLTTGNAFVSLGIYGGVSFANFSI
mmetsp:Transcript_96284/g.132435  ORF Transcript_96284/g.132435 Transcript_96284/m.132435 type:complete len:101 (-) Transcript_96284:1155-1457(-)